MNVLAISDLHLDFEENRRALHGISQHADDWLIIAGDVGHSEEHLRFVLELLAPRFRRLVWVPGNHDLWCSPDKPGAVRGVEKYERLVGICRSYDVLTPEDPYASLRADDGSVYAIAPLFLLYDYSFRPDDVPLEDAVRWAVEENILCADELHLHPDPYPSRSAWCAERCDLTERQLAEVPREHRLVLVNHFPLRRDLVQIRIPRFIIWCGTRRTEDWHTRFNAAVVVSGHLHVRSTKLIDSVRFEEVSLGYPRQWPRERDINSFLRCIIDTVAPAPGVTVGYAERERR